MPDRDPENLARLARSGDKRAFEELTTRLVPRLEHQIRARMGERVRSQLEVGDLVQETLLKAWGALDERDGTLLEPLYPLDRAQNADSKRRRLKPIEQPSTPTPPPSGDVPPLLQKLLGEYSATGLPPAYLPKTHKRKEAGG